MSTINHQEPRELATAVQRMSTPKSLPFRVSPVRQVQESHG